jgi:putative hydrolase of the HAD superfamily
MTRRSTPMFWLRSPPGVPPAARHFDAIHYSAALGACKPEAAFFERLHAGLPDVAPNEVIFLDDVRANVDAANAFGWRASHFRSAEDLRTALRSSASPRDSGSL